MAKLDASLIEPTSADNGAGTNVLVPTDKKKRAAMLEQAKKLMSTGMSLEELQSTKPVLAKLLEEHYGYALALIASDTGLTKLFSQAVRQGMTEDGFVNALRGTNWFLSRNESQRKYETASKTPWMKADLEAKRKAVAEEIKSQAMAVGGTTVSDEEALSFANDVLMNYFEDADWQQALPKMVSKRFVSNNIFNFGGEAGQTLDALRKNAYEMGVSLSDETLGRYVDSIFAGETNIADVEKIIRNSAASYFPQFAERINAGEKTKDIIDPYRQIIGSMLEVDYNSIDYINTDGSKAEPLLQQALFGQQDGKAMSLADVRKLVKKDTRWRYTDNARAEYSSIASELARTFGGGF